MKKVLSVLTLVALVSLAVLSFSSVASADEVKFVGVITKIELAGKDAKTATVTMKDNADGKLIPITINDDLTIDKLNDHRIVEGDEIRCKYEVVDGKNVSKLFRKTAGC
jgi:hypothetical protein